MPANPPAGDMAVSQVWTDPVTGAVVGVVTREGVVQAAGFQAAGGLLYIPAQAGAPSGTPDAQNGMVPVVFDTTTGQIWVFNGAWKAVTLS